MATSLRGGFNSLIIKTSQITIIEFFFPGSKTEVGNIPKRSEEQGKGRDERSESARETGVRPHPNSQPRCQCGRRTADNAPFI